MTREFKSHRGRYLMLCRVGREADGACLESKLSNIWYIGSNPIPYVIYSNRLTERPCGYEPQNEGSIPSWSIILTYSSGLRGKFAKLVFVSPNLTVKLALHHNMISAFKIPCSIMSYQGRFYKFHGKNLSSANFIGISDTNKWYTIISPVS